MKSQPTVAVLEDLRQTIKKPPNLRRARELWWKSLQTVCMVNQLWDIDSNEVVKAKDRRLNTSVIKLAKFDTQSYKTVLQLVGQSTLLEIEL